MKVLMGLPDKAGCGHYRIRYPGAAVKALGHEVEIVDQVNVRMQADANGRLSITEVQIADDVEVAVFQRPLRATDLSLIQLLQKRGVAVVVDIDDDFSAVDPAHQGWRNYQPRFSPHSNRVHLQRCCQQADLVTVTTPALARRYGAHGRVAVLPNCVPEAMTKIGALVESDGRTIGWAGHTETHPNDLQVTRGGVARAVRELGARFLNVGSGTNVARFLGMEVHEVEVSGAVSFEDYPYAVARFDVGIVPLADSAFNEAKSGLKGLEMAALGVPFVASPTPEYRRLEALGIGRTTKNRGRNWCSAIKEMYGEAGKEAAAQAREVVRERFTYEGEGWRWAEAWEQAIANRKAGLAVCP